ncbi:toll/interleukin-1 receptor domain-containing protein [Aurantiacibacter sp. MUD11]|uniref:toll/interleukin-1 receptor domain-containing protein n=1 Tax=Aurantiacibacter sp. MUD11 TaxID=3003265 RepID=UPI003FA4464B
MREVIVAKSINEAQILGRKTAFLCHSHRDKTLVEGFVKHVQNKGWRIYIDWMDTTLPSKPNRTTASKIQLKIRTTDFFIFLATHNSMASRWCPWEIGYADGVRSLDTILIAETRDDAGNYHGNEYLGLYRRLSFDTAGTLRVWGPGTTTGGIKVSDL